MSYTLDPDFFNLAQNPISFRFLNRNKTTNNMRNKETMRWALLCRAVAEKSNIFF